MICLRVTSTYVTPLNVFSEAVAEDETSLSDGVDMYFYNEDYETKGYDFIRHYSFEELLSGVDVTK